MNIPYRKARGKLNKNSNLKRLAVSGVVSSVYSYLFLRNFIRGQPRHQCEWQYKTYAAYVLYLTDLYLFKCNCNISICEMYAYIYITYTYTYISYAYISQMEMLQFLHENKQVHTLSKGLTLNKLRAETGWEAPPSFEPFLPRGRLI